MAEPVSLQTLLTYLTLISVPVGVFYHIMTLRNTRKNQKLTLETRQTQLFMDIYQTWASKEFQKDLDLMLYVWEYDDFDDFMRKYGSEADIDAHSIWDQNSMWLEGIGVLVRRGLIAPQLIFDLQSFSGTMLLTWKKFAPFILGFRERFDLKEYMQDFEYLREVILEIYEREHPESGILRLIGDESARNVVFHSKQHPELKT
jgi:hypothetical protein